MWNVDILLKISPRLNSTKMWNSLDSIYMFLFNSPLLVKEAYPTALLESPLPQCPLLVKEAYPSALLESPLPQGLTLTLCWSLPSRKAFSCISCQVSLIEIVGDIPLNYFSCVSCRLSAVGIVGDIPSMHLTSDSRRV